MSILTFDRSKFEALLADAKRAFAQDRDVRTYCGEYNEPGFWLVGDEGIYLMHNGKTHIRKSGSFEVGASNADPLVTIFANECDPSKHGDVWDRKQRMFGGDDGVEFIDLKSAEAWLTDCQKQGRATLKISLTSKMMELK